MSAIQILDSHSFFSFQHISISKYHNLYKLKSSRWRFVGVIVASRTIEDIVLSRRYTELEAAALDYLDVGDGEWKNFLTEIENCGSPGKSRDALISLLQLESVGGTDSDVFKEFSSLNGTTLDEIRSKSIDHAIKLLRSQISDRHTHFLDVEALASSHFAVLVKDIIESRNGELENLNSNPSRIDVLNTYYGYTILTKEGASEGIKMNLLNQEAMAAFNEISTEIAHEISMDPQYKTLASKSIFKRKCMPSTALILSENVKLSLYMLPGHRAAAAKQLGKSEDSRAMPYLSHRIEREESQKVQLALIEAIGNIGLPSSLNLIYRYIPEKGRTPSNEKIIAAAKALAGIDTSNSVEILIRLLKNTSTALKAVAIDSLAHLNPPNLFEILIPCLNHKSRTIVRASVRGLFKQGKKGEDVVLDHLFRVLVSLGCDIASEKVIRKLLSLPGVASREDVHDYYASRIARMTKRAESLQSFSNFRSYWEYTPMHTRRKWWSRSREDIGWS